MSRHRNVRTMNYDDEYDDDDDYQYSHSVEDECISPTDAQQWIYDRAKGQQSMSAFLANHRDIEEENADELEADREQSEEERQKLQRRDSECYQMPQLDEENRARLVSCMEEIRNIIGETTTDRQLVEAIMKHNYDFNKALDDVLNSSKTPPTLSPAVVAAKNTKEPIGKDYQDFQISKLSIDQEPSLVTQNKPRFNIPSVRFDSSVAAASSSFKTDSNLNDLLKSRIKQQSMLNSESDSEKSEEDYSGRSLLPKLSDLSLNSDSGVASSSPAESTFANLTDLARFRLQTQSGTPVGSPLKTQTSGFKIPNLFNTPSIGQPPGLSIGSSKKSNKLLGKDDWIIDLRSALVKDKSEISCRRKTANKLGSVGDVEPFNYGFIDCDIVEIKPVIDEYCNIDSSAVLDRELSNRTLTSSEFARVLCLRYHKRSITRVRHGFVNKPRIVPFRFDVLSPDDVVLEHLKKFKR